MATPTERIQRLEVEQRAISENLIALVEKVERNAKMDERIRYLEDEENKRIGAVKVVFMLSALIGTIAGLIKYA